MGLIQAAIGAVSSTMADQWKDYYYCDSIPADVLMIKGQKRVTGWSSNRRGSDNIITNGSVIAVNEGQCMIVVEQGKILDVCAEPGAYKYDSSASPSLFAGAGLSETLQEVWERLCAGGQAVKDQRVYFVNIKEITGNKYGTPNPVPFRVVDTNIGLDMDVSVKCFGEYSIKITNPILFYTNVASNVAESYTRDQLDGQLRSELLTALQPAFAKISEMGIRYSALPGHTFEIANALNDVLSAKWGSLRGIEIVSFGVSGVKADEEDEKAIKELQRAATFRNPNMAGAALAAAQAEAMKAAANNSNGAAMGFMGMGMAQQAGGVNVQQLFAMGQQQAQAQPVQPQQMVQPEQPAQASAWQSVPAKAAAGAPAADGWTCPACGKEGNSGKFCAECGAARPAEKNEEMAEEGWLCTCGSRNMGKFCSNCGAKRPAGAPVYVCDKCGWKPEDPANPPKFCPECGDPFNDDDLVK